MVQNRKLIIMGMMGSGKTTMARFLANELDIDYLDLDAYIESSTGLTVPELFAQSGEDQFRNVEHEALKEILGMKGRLILALGGGTPCFERNSQLFTSEDLTVYLKYTATQLAHHLEGQQAGRPLLSSSEVPLETVLEDLLANRSHWYEQADVVLEGHDEKPLDRALYQLAVDYFAATSGHNS